MTRLVWLPVNQVWAFMLCGHLIRMGDGFLFDDRAAAVRAATGCGLRIDGAGIVSPIP